MNYICALCLCTSLLFGYPDFPMPCIDDIHLLDLPDLQPWHLSDIVPGEIDGGRPAGCLRDPISSNHQVGCW